MDKKDILELVRQVQIGDQAAFAKIYDEFSQRLYAFIRIKVNTTSEAEDILQDVFLKAWTGCRKLDVSNLNFSAWLYKVAANTTNDHYRKKYREPQQVALEEAAELANTDSPADDASRGLERDVIKQTMDRLPPHYKEVIELRYFQDFSVADTAQIMGKTSVTVRVWQHRAMAQLKTLFTKYGEARKQQQLEQPQ